MEMSIETLHNLLTTFFRFSISFLIGIPKNMAEAFHYIEHNPKNF